MEHIILDISGINDFGHSYLDWEYAKRKQTDPDLTFLDILNEKMEKLKEEDRIDKNTRADSISGDSMLRNKI